MEYVGVVCTLVVKKKTKQTKKTGFGGTSELSLSNNYILVSGKGTMQKVGITLVRFPNPLTTGRHSWQLGNLTKQPPTNILPQRQGRNAKRTHNPTLYQRWPDV